MKAVNVIYHQNASSLDEEKQWVEAAKADPKAFESLYKKYYTDIFRFIWKRTANEELTAILVSDVFIKALQNIQKFSYRGVPFSAWLHQIARNEINLYYRKSQKNRSVSFGTDQIRECIHDLEEDDREEQLALLINALNELSTEELELVEMRYFEKRSFKEVSEILDIKEGNAKVKMHRVMQKLKSIILNQ